MRLFEIYGIVFGSEFPLPGRELPATLDTEREAIRVQFDRDIDFSQEPLPAASQLDALGDGLWIWTAADGHHLRVGARCEACIDHGQRNLRVRSASAHDESLGLTLLSGTFSTFLLILRGLWPLHASAVRWANRGVAIVGASGMGKSTWAAALCSVGAELITDDVLVLEQVGLDFQCVPGTNTLRLRSTELGRWDAATPPSSSDGRFLWSPQSADQNTPLSAVVIPARADITEPDVDHLDPIAAVQALSAYPRICGWVSPVMRERQFRVLAAIARSVPVVKVSLPLRCRPHDLPQLLPGLLQQARAQA